MYCNSCHYDIPTLDSKKCTICGSKDTIQNQYNVKNSSKGKIISAGVVGALAIITLVFVVGNLNISEESISQIIESPEVEKLIETKNNVLEEVTTIQEKIIENSPKNLIVTRTYTDQELSQYALDLVNEDRKKHGTSPVKLGSINSAQVHADDQLENSYFSHWNSEGVKPYVTYTKLGGTANVGENNAFTESYCPTTNCIPNVWDPYKQIKSHQYSMMYDDASSDWGHRDNIIDPHHTHVNFGVTWNSNEFYFVQHFETKIIQLNNLEIVNDKTLNLNGDIPSNYKLSNISIFEDDSSKQVSGISLNNEFPYNAGYYDQGKFVGMIVEPTQPGYFYEECSSGKIRTTGTEGVQCTNYVIYDEIGRQVNQLNIRADISQWLSQPGLHTIYVNLEDTDTGEEIQATSLTLEYLN